MDIPPTLREIVLDFSYLKGPDVFESKIQNSTEMVERDLDFKDNNFDILKVCIPSLAPSLALLSVFNTTCFSVSTTSLRGSSSTFKI
jgi:hypothetical protein